eukprot:XP_019862181.1 PREDICTED: uncharacterized protein LOC109590742 [Amphimedon queenslandica]
MPPLRLVFAESFIAEFFASIFDAAIIAPMNLTDQFLIAMPGMIDPGFERTVALICAHNEEGAMGIVINRPIDMRFTEILSQMRIRADDSDVDRIPLIQGGPVRGEVGFVLHYPAGEFQSVLTLESGIGVATSKDILSAAAKGEGPPKAIVALGYAGWHTGQLENEIRQNAWLTGPADARIVFEVPFDRRWDEATRSLGIDPSQLSSQAGHA